MSHALKCLGLLLVLLLAQQGAVVHELSHVSAALSAGSKLDAGNSVDACAQCPAFAQASTPAFSHAFQLPLKVLITAQLTTELTIAAIEAALPDPRSRGPPASN